MTNSTHAVRSENGRIARVLELHQNDLLQEWVSVQAALLSARGSISESELRTQSREFLALLRAAVGSEQNGVDSPAWAETQDFLADLSRSRAQQGFTPSQTATFVFSLKEPLFNRLRAESHDDADALATDVWTASRLLDALGLYTMEVFQRSREEIIAR
ncbi:MAG: RsbRD N-terminal domain-containing protein, partial [Gemmatimonadaceae bacterium]